MFYLVLDTETGGLDPNQHSLIEVACHKTTSRFQVLDTFQMRIKHKFYGIDPDSLQINKIDLRDASSWIVSDEAKKSFFRFLDVPEDIDVKGTSSLKYTLCGTNIVFDIGFIKKWIGDRAFEQCFTIRPEEITSGFAFLQNAGIVPFSQGYQLKHMLQALGIEFDSENLHGALYDADMATKCAREMVFRSDILKDALKYYVSKYGGDLDSVIDAYRKPNKKAALKRLRTKKANT